MSIVSFFGEIITEDTYIIDIKKKGITVALNPLCDDNNACKGCNHCETSKKITKYFIAVSNSHTFTRGSKIRIKHFSPHVLISVFFVFVVPLLCILGTMVTWQLVKPDLAESGLAVSTALCAGVIGFLLNGIIENGFRYWYPPRILS